MSGVYLGHNLLSVEGAAATFSGARVRSTTDQAGLTSATYIKKTFETEDYDIGDWWDTTNNRFVVPAGVTKIHLDASAMIRMDSATVWAAAVLIYKNGTAYILSRYAEATSAVEMFKPVISFDDAVIPGDYFEVYGYAYDEAGATWKLFASAMGQTFFDIRALA